MYFFGFVFQVLTPYFYLFLFLFAFPPYNATTRTQ